MEQQASEADFERLSWHDDTIYGVRFDVGDSDRNEWHSNLVLDIDHIVEWLCDEAGGARFRVAPANLTFHNVTDLKIAVDWGDSGCQVSIHPVSIDGITREQIQNQKICLDRPYYRWRIALNWPQGGAIAFGASGFTQSLRAEPLLCDQPKLSPAERN